jgi:hypothetical protein
LAAGAVTITLTASNETVPKGQLSADRNVDVVMLNNNLTDIKMRSVNEQQLALGGLLTQHDEVFMKVTNRGTDMNLSIPFCAYHSAYGSQHMYCIPMCHPQKGTGKVYSSIAALNIFAKAGSTTSKWVEVGSRMDAFDDGTVVLRSCVVMRSVIGSRLCVVMRSVIDSRSCIVSYCVACCANLRTHVLLCCTLMFYCVAHSCFTGTWTFTARPFKTPAPSIRYSYDVIFGVKARGSSAAVEQVSDDVQSQMS